MKDTMLKADDAFEEHDCEKIAEHKAKWLKDAESFWAQQSGRGEAAKSEKLEKAYRQKARAWFCAELTQRFETIVTLNTKMRVFPPDTLVFGLVLGYFTIGDLFIPLPV